MSHLMYSPNNETLLTPDQLAMLPLPPAIGRFHHPYPFSSYVEDIHHALDVNGLQVVGEEYAVDHDNSRMFGVMEIEPLTGELITAKDWKLLLGVAGSHDQAISRKLCLGSSILVCTNLCFHGNIGTFKTKQTTNIGARLPGLIRDAVAHVPELAQSQQIAFDRYKDFEMKPRWGDAALVEIHRRGGLTGAQLSRAVQEWDEPSHPEHAQHEFSAWRLFNACTEAVKPTGNTVNMATIQERTQHTSAFINEMVGL